MGTSPPQKLMGSWNLEPAKYRGEKSKERHRRPKPTNLRIFQCEGSNNRKHVAIQHLLILVRIKYHLLRHYLQQHPTQAAAERAEASHQTCCTNTFLKSSVTSNLEPIVSMNHDEKTHAWFQKISMCVWFFVIFHVMSRQHHFLIACINMVHSFQSVSLAKSDQAFGAKLFMKNSKAL